MDAGEKGAGPKLAEDVMKFKQARVNGGSNFRRLSLQFWLRRPSRNSRERLPFLYLGKRLPQFWALRRDCKNRRSGGWVAPGFGPDSAGGMDGWMDGWMGSSRLGQGAARVGGGAFGEDSERGRLSDAMLLKKGRLSGGACFGVNSVWMMLKCPKSRPPPAHMLI